MPSSIITVGDCAFEGSCSKLQKLNIPTGIESIGAKAFYNYTGNVIVPRNVTVGTGAFYNTSTLCPSEGTDITNAPWGAHDGQIHDFDENGVCKICGHVAKILFGSNTGDFGRSGFNKYGESYSYGLASAGVKRSSFNMKVLETVSIPIKMGGNIYISDMYTNAFEFTITDENNNIIYSKYVKYSDGDGAYNFSVDDVLELNSGNYTYSIAWCRGDKLSGYYVGYTKPLSCNW